MSDKPIVMGQVLCPDKTCGATVMALKDEDNRPGFISAQHYHRHDKDRFCDGGLQQVPDESIQPLDEKILELANRAAMSQL